MKQKLILFLQKFTFKTGVWTLGLCVIFYALSFIQMALPISLTAKTVLWVLLFGLAKTAQYAGLMILGSHGLRRLKTFFSKPRL